ncbi:MAG: hypothetical protein QOD99_737 [Chthoniobacter sp.]|jgi:hypothetical protein|nr:hypothetical protein [Chthoniobacter sp.]
MKRLTYILPAAALASLLSSCATCKIQPPPTVIGTSKEGAAKVAAKALPTSIADAEVSGNYKNVVNETFATVNQDDVAFYLLLQAYECESSHHRQAAANGILQVAREELARRHGGSTTAVATHPETLTSTEQRVLRTSPLKEEIATKIAEPKSQ